MKTVEEYLAEEAAIKPTDIIKRVILLARFNISLNTWNEFTERHSDSQIVRLGRSITFEGTAKDFDKLHDKLIANESNSKIIGIYPN